MAEIIRGGIEAVDKGQMEAARSLGLSYGKAMRKVILPQAFRTMLPSIINQFIISLKDTSLVSVIGPRELTQNDYCGQFRFHGYAHLDLRGPVLSGSLHDSVQDCQVCGEESVLWKIRFQSIT